MADTEAKKPEEEVPPRGTEVRDPEEPKKRAKRKTPLPSFVQGLVRPLSEAPIQDVPFATEKILRSRGLGSLDSDPLFGPSEKALNEANRLQQPLLIGAGDKPEKQRSTAPLMPPTIRREYEQAGLADLIPQWREEFGRQAKHLANAEEKVAAMVSSLDRSENYRNQLRKRLDSGDLSQTGEIYAKAAFGVYEGLKDVGGLQGVPAGQVSTMIESAFLGEMRFGPKGLRVSLLNDPETGRPLIVVPDIFNRLQQTYLDQIVRERGSGTPEQRAEYLKEATKEAGRDLLRAAQASRNVAFFDPIDPESLKKLAETPAPLRSMKAFFRRRTETEPFAPRLRDLERESPLDFIFRMGPWDYAAPQLKLVREYLEKNDFADDPIAVTAAAAFSFAPLGISEAALERLGFTPEDQIESYLQGTLFMEEGIGFIGMWAKELALATGSSEAQAEKVKEDAERSKLTAVAAFLPYMVEPDAITVGLLGMGYGASKALKVRRTTQLQKQQEKVRQIVADAETPQEALSKLKALDPVIADIYGVHLLREVGEKSASDVQRAADGLETQQKSLEKATEKLEEGTRDFLRRFLNGEEVDPDKIAAAIVALRKESPGAVEEALEAVGRDFTDSISARSRLTADIAGARTAERQAEGEFLRITDQLERREKAEKGFEEVVKRALQEFTPQTQALWGIETQLQQLYLLQNFYAKLTREGASEAKLNRALERMLLVRSRAVGPEKMSAGPKGGETFAAIHALGRDLDKTSLKKIKLFAKEHKIKIPSGATKAEVIAEIRKYLIIDEAHAADIVKDLSRRIDELRFLQKDAIDELKATKAGRTKLKKLQALRVEMRGHGNALIKAIAQLPYGSEGRLAVLSEEVTRLAKAQGDMARMAPGMDRRIVNAYTLYRAYRPTSESRKLLRGALRLTKTGKGARAVELSPRAKAAAEALRKQRGLQKVPNILRVTDIELQAIGKLLDKTIKAEERVSKAQTAGQWRTVIERVADRIDADLAKLDERLMRNVRRQSGRDMVGLREGVANAADIISPRITQTADRVATLTVENFRLMEADLVMRFGRDAVDFAFRRSGSASDALSRAKKGKTVTLSLDEMEELQTTLPRVLVAASERSAQGGGHYNLALFVLRSQAQAPTPHIRNWMRRSIEIFLRTWDPFRGRIGAASADVNKLVSATENYTHQMREEIVLLIRQAAKERLTDEDFAKVMSEYFDSGRSLALPQGRHTILSSGTPLYLRFKQQVRASAGDWLDRWAVGKDDIVDGDLVTALQQAHKGKKSKDLSPKVGKLVDEIDPSIQAFSRAWLPHDVQLTSDEALKAVAALYRDAIKIINKADTFADAVNRMRGATGRRLPGIDVRVGRSYAFSAYAVGLGAAKDSILPLARGATGGRLTPDEVKDVNAILGGPMSYRNIKNIDRSIDVMVEMGLPLTEGGIGRGASSAAEAGKAGTATKSLVRIGQDARGEDVFTLSTVRDEINATLGNSIKELTRLHDEADLPLQMLIRLVQKFQTLWKQSATTGLVIPNAGYITYVRVGDMSQLFMTSGFSFAARATLRNVWSDIPWIGRPLQDHYQRLADKTGKPVLRSGIETSFNPHVSDFLSGEAKFYRLPNGRLIDGAKLKERAVHDGILDTFVSEALEETLRNVGETSIAALDLPAHYAKRALKEWSAKIRDFSSQTQQRQRVGTWLLHISDGKSIEDATRLTQEALYDWSHGIAKWEQRYIAKYFPFWRYWRLSMNQTTNALLRPLMNPAKGDYLKAVYGQTRMNRFRVLVRGQLDLSPMLTDPRTPEEIMEEDGYRAALGKALNPSWAFGQLKTGHGALSLYEQSFNRRTGAGETTHEMRLGPMIHGYDHAEVGLMPFIAFMGIALELNGETAAADDLWKKTQGTILDKLFPTFRDLLQTDRKLHAPGDIVSIRPVEAWIIQRLMPMMDVMRDPETGKYKTTAANRVLIRNLPVIGMELPRLMNAAYFKNPEIHRDVTKGIQKFMLEYTRLVRSYPYSLDEQLNYRAKPTLKSLSALDKRTGYLVRGQPGFDEFE